MAGRIRTKRPVRVPRPGIPKAVTFNEYVDSVAESDQRAAGFWNHVLNYLKDECKPAHIGEDGQAYYSIVDLSAAEDYATGKMES